MKQETPTTAAVEATPLSSQFFASSVNCLPFNGQLFVTIWNSKLLHIRAHTHTHTRTGTGTRAATGKGRGALIRTKPKKRKFVRILSSTWMDGILVNYREKP